MTKLLTHEEWLKKRHGMNYATLSEDLGVIVDREYNEYAKRMERYGTESELIKAGICPICGFTRLNNMRNIITFRLISEPEQHKNKWIIRCFRCSFKKEVKTKHD